MNRKIRYVLNELTDEDRRKLWLELSNKELAGSIRQQIELVSIGELQDVIERHYQNYGKFQGVSTGYKLLDKFTKGLVGGELIVVAGRTSHGKTSLATNIVYNVAQARNVLFITLEMTHRELGSRLRHIHNRPVDLPILFQKNDELDWQSIDPLMEKAKQEKVELVIIDHLHYFTRELENVAEDLGRITKEIKKNAIRHDLPVVLVSHVRKARGKAKANIEDLRGSSLISQDADIVLMVHRDADRSDWLHVTIEKNRNRGFDPNDNLATYGFDGTRITELV